MNYAMLEKLEYVRERIHIGRNELVNGMKG